MKRSSLGGAQRASRLQHFDLHGVVRAFEAGEQSGLQLRPGTLEEVNQVAVVANARLEEAVVNVISEIHRLAVGRILITRAVQIRHSRDVFGEHGGQLNRHGIRLERGQRVVANMEIPQRVQNAFAPQGRALAQHLGKHLGLVAHHGFVAILDAVLVLHPGRLARTQAPRYPVFSSSRS